MLRFIALLLAIGCAVVAGLIGAEVIDSPYFGAWLAASLALFEASFLPDRPPR